MAPKHGYDSSSEEEALAPPPHKAPSAAAAPKKTAPPPRKVQPANPRDFAEMCELYPCLGERMKEVEKMYPGLQLERRFCMISDDNASALDAEFGKQKLMLMMKLDQELIKVLLADLADK